MGGVTPNRPLRTARLTEAQIQAMLQMAIADGGLAVARDSYPNDQVADASTATFLLNAGGLSKAISVYALGIEAPGGQDAEARAAFGRLAQRLGDFDQGGSIASAEYVPDRYRGVLMDGGAGNAAKPWPWPDVTPADFVVPPDANGLRLPAKVLTVAQAEALGIRPYIGGFQGLSLAGPAGDGTFSFALRPLLPGDDMGPTPTAAPTAVPNPTDGPPRDVRYTPISTLARSADGRRIDLTFVGAKSFAANDPCSADYAATTKVVGGVLEVGVFESRRPALPVVACDAVGYSRRLSVDLPVPFTGTTWRDLFGPYVHFLSAPSGLVRITIPDGLSLVRERDVEDSETGRWERTYAPAADAPPERTLVLYQAFGGPANVTGGDETRQVTVNDKPATLYRHPPSGELVLVWELGGDGLALVGYEPAFTPERLIAIAESATPPTR